MTHIVCSSPPGCRCRRGLTGSPRWPNPAPANGFYCSCNTTANEESQGDLTGRQILPNRPSRRNKARSTPVLGVEGIETGRFTARKPTRPFPDRMGKTPCETPTRLYKWPGPAKPRLHNVSFSSGKHWAAALARFHQSGSVGVDFLIPPMTHNRRMPTW